MAENTFCFLKGLVECESGRIQDCNVKRVTKCMLEEDKKVKSKQKETPVFCYLKGVVDCPPGRVQDCNVKHLNQCMLEQENQ